MFSRSLFAAMSVLGGVVAVVACSAARGNGSSGNGNGGMGGTSTGSQGLGLTFNTSTGSGAPGPCVGLQCQAQMDACASKGKPATTISGTVYDPKGALPLYDVYVYIAGTTPDPITPGNPTCTQCEAPASGNPVIGTLTDTSGHFTLSQGATDPWGVPSGSNLTLVLQAGKWRRQIVLPQVVPCTANPIPDPATPSAKLRLPAKSSEGDMPLIAFTSGCDPAECFLRDVGIDDSEFVPPGSTTGHVHFYTALDSSNGTDASSVQGGNTSGDTYAWWTSAANLLKYDIVFNACECNDNDRNMAGNGNAYAAMDAYLSGGGRVFATHYYYNWFAPPTGTADLQGVASWALPEDDTYLLHNYTYFIDTSFPKGQSFATWLQAQNVTQTLGQIALTDTRYDMNATTGLSSRWIYFAQDATSTKAPPMYMSFNAPVGHPPAMQCGRAVFSDVHLSGTSDDSQFPNECADQDPSYAVNEKALEFLFFDLSSCVQDDTQPPTIPPTAQ
jgi:hypothetical protein